MAAKRYAQPLFFSDVNNHINASNIVIIRCLWQARQHHMIRRNINQPVIRRVIKMMMVCRVGIKQAIFIMHRYPPQKPSIGKLVQCIIHRTTSHMQSSGVNFSGQAFGGYMSVPAIKQKTSNGDALAGWTQTSRAQFRRHRHHSCWRGRIIFFGRYIRRHSHNKMRSLPEIVNITLANGGVSCFFNAFYAFVYST